MATILEFTQSWSTTARVINAVILREISGRFGSSRLGYLWALITPAFSIGALYFVFLFIRNRDSGEIPLLMFVVTGWFTYGLYTSMVSDLGNAEGSNRALLMHSQVQRLDVLIARATLATLTNFTFFGCAALVGALVEGSGFPQNMMLVFQSFCSAGLLGVSLGITIAGLSTYYPYALQFLQPVNRIGFFVSGVLFTADMLPSWTYAYLKWNPMIHPVEGMRQGWFETYQSPILDLNYTFAIAVPLLAVGLYLERRTRRGIKF
ncbi:MAG: ABC transporter permease [Pseudomonadota bacterium]